ncbi:MAG: VWA domain-containing protein [Anaerolineae bacterium]|jgi:uncharacterized protein with von Willebrand factor type A (vWA) domain|nr:VWA domain-containing protein [Anaerolineae bacterium]
MSSNNLRSLFKNQPGLSHQSIDLMVQNLDGQAGLGCVGAQVDELNTDDVTLLVVLLDASGSMDSVRQPVLEAFNELCRALMDSKSRDSILMSAWTFHDRPALLFGYTPIDQVQDLTPAQYQPDGGTALFDAVLSGFTGIVGYGQDLRNNGIRTRSIVVVMTDGGDNMSASTAAAVKTVAGDLIRQEFYTLAFVGLGDEKTFRHIADSMGFPEVLTVANTAADIRKALHMISGSVIRTSTGQIAPGTNSFFNP